MCESCVVVESIVDTGGVAHIGYGSSEKEAFRKLLEDDVVVEIDSEVERMKQTDFLKLWKRFIEKTDAKDVDALRPSGGTFGCALCNTSLVTAPGVEATCDCCGRSKHETIRMASQSRMDAERRMDESESESSITLVGREDLLDSVLQAGLHCPNGHWLCSDCWRTAQN